MYVKIYRIGRNSNIGEHYRYKQDQIGKKVYNQLGSKKSVSVKLCFLFFSVFTDFAF